MCTKQIARKIQRGTDLFPTNLYSQCLWPRNNLIDSQHCWLFAYYVTIFQVNEIAQLLHGSPTLFSKPLPTLTFTSIYQYILYIRTLSRQQIARQVLRGILGPCYAALDCWEAAWMRGALMQEGAGALKLWHYRVIFVCYSSAKEGIISTNQHAYWSNEGPRNKWDDAFDLIDQMKDPFPLRFQICQG